MNKIEQIAEKMTQFEAIECVVRNAENSELDARFFEHVAPCLQKIADKQNLTSDQALIFCLMMNFCDSSHIRLGELARHTGLSAVHLLKYLNDIDELVKRGFLKQTTRHNDRGYAIRHGVIKALKQDVAFEKKSHRGISCSELFDLIGQILNEEDDYDAQKEQILVEKFQKIAEERIAAAQAEAQAAHASRDEVAGRLASVSMELEAQRLNAEDNA